MQLTFRASFFRDVKHLQDARIKRRIRDVIAQVQAAPNLEQVNSISKLAGYPGAFRIRIGDYRIGLFALADKVEFVRVLHRREIYRYFP